MKPDFISAWTLIGHEYIEMRNFAEAISSYHKGINLDPTDSRAWFGLGQAFFFLKMYSFSAQNYLKVSFVFHVFLDYVLFHGEFLNLNGFRKFSF